MWRRSSHELQSNSDDEREDVEVCRSHPPASSASVQGEGYSKMEFVAPQPGSTSGLWWRLIQGSTASTFGRMANASYFDRGFFSVGLGIAVAWFLFSTITSKGPPTYTSAGRPVRWADYPKLIDLQTRAFDQLLYESVGYGEFVLEVKKAEMVSNGLTALAGVRDLNGKDQVAERLSRFVEDARGAGQSLHSLGVKVQEAVDSYVSCPSTKCSDLNSSSRITSLNEHALQAIEVSKAPPSLAARVIPFFLSNSNRAKGVVIETFLLSMDNIGIHMVRLRREVETSMDHLMVLREVTHREIIGLKAAQADILAELWAVLGGKGHKLRETAVVLDLFENMERCRKKALAHVVATSQTLHTLDADMEELRIRVAVPDMIWDRLPIEVHIENIKAGVDRLMDRLNESQTRARRTPEYTGRGYSWKFWQNAWTHTTTPQGKLSFGRKFVRIAASNIKSYIRGSWARQQDRGVHGVIICTESGQCSR